MKKKEQKLYAIWTYGSPPYWLGGVVEEMCEDGYVKVDGYEGMQFKYWKLYPLKEGLRVQEKLNTLKSTYIVAKDKAHDNLKTGLEELFDIKKGNLWESR